MTGKEDGTGQRHTTEELRELVRSVRDGTFHYDGRPKKSLDRSTYDELQVREVSSMPELKVCRRCIRPRAASGKGEEGKASCLP
nr:putative transposase [uncultured archaeon]